MDGRPHDPDDDITVVGDHELVVELRRQGGRPLPPPAPLGCWDEGDVDGRAPVVWVVVAFAVVAAVLVALVLAR